MTETVMEDQQIYCREMAKGIDEKLFFDELEIDTLVDFGCADGQVSTAIREKYGYDVIGYDKNEDLLPEKSFAGETYTNDWDEVTSSVSGDRFAIYLSSILHEVYSFGKEQEVYNKVLSCDPNYIIIRDMHILDEDKKGFIESDRLNEIVDNVSLRLVNSFVCNHGPLMSKGNLIHFLMKHRFAYNWDYEIQEDYMAVTEDRLDLWRRVGNVVFEDHSPLSYYQDVFAGRYGYELTTPTHIKLIIKVT